MVIKLQTNACRESVFANIKNLKDHKNSKNRFFSVRMQTTDKLNEEDYRKRQIIQENKKLPLPQRQKIDLKKGKLTIAKNPYVKKIDSIDVKTLLSYTHEEILEVKECKVSTSSMRQDEGSIFIAYAAKVDTIEQTRSFYRHIRIKHADATHVILGYRLPGIDKAYGEDFVDDGEHGGGRRILNYLIDNEQTSQAIIMVRNFGNVYLGIKRFQHITELATEALESLNSGHTAISKLQLAKPTNPQLRCFPPVSRSSYITQSQHTSISAGIRHAKPVSTHTRPFLSQPPMSNRFATLTIPSTDDDDISLDDVEGSSRYASLDDVNAEAGTEDWSNDQAGEWDQE